MQTAPLRPLRGVVKGEDCSPPRFCGSTHSIWDPPHASGPPLARAKSQDGPPDAGTIEPPHRDAFVGVNSPATEEDDNTDADPCCVAATTEDASIVSSPV